MGETNESRQRLRILAQIVSAKCKSFPQQLRYGPYGEISIRGRLRETEHPKPELGTLHGFWGGALRREREDALGFCCYETRSRLKSTPPPFLASIGGRGG